MNNKVKSKRKNVKSGSSKVSLLFSVSPCIEFFFLNTPKRAHNFIPNSIANYKSQNEFPWDLRREKAVLHFQRVI